MTPRQKLPWIAIGLLSLGAGAETARGDANSSHHREHKAHAHGIAELTMAIEGNRLELALVSPAVNIVGFEHRASTPAQIESLDDARASLESPAELFRFTGTRCTPDEISVDVDAVMSDGEPEHHEEHHDEHHDEHHEEHHEEHHQDDHDEHHDDDHDEHHEDGHDEHQDDHHDEHHDAEHEGDHHGDEHDDAGHHGEERHSNIEASYRFSCANGAELRSVSVEILTRFPGIEKLNAMWVTDAGQGAAPLSAQSRVIKLR